MGPIEEIDMVISAGKEVFLLSLALMMLITISFFPHPCVRYVPTVLLDGLLLPAGVEGLTPRLRPRVLSGEADALGPLREHAGQDLEAGHLFLQRQKVLHPHHHEPEQTAAHRERRHGPLLLTVSPFDPFEPFDPSGPFATRTLFFLPFGEKERTLFSHCVNISRSFSEKNVCTHTSNLSPVPLCVARSFRTLFPPNAWV